MMIAMPRDENGRFVPLACPVPTCDGTLRYQGHRSWECDGLVDPENTNRELQACTFDHLDGHHYLPHHL